MLENIPSQSTLTELLGRSLFGVWQELCSVIDENVAVCTQKVIALVL